MKDRPNPQKGQSGMCTFIIIPFSWFMSTPSGHIFGHNHLQLCKAGKFNWKYILTNVISSGIISKRDISLNNIEQEKFLMDEKLIKYLPLSEATYFVMISLVDPLHGYGIMQHIEKISQGSVTGGPGTLYGILSTLE